MTIRVFAAVGFLAFLTTFLPAGAETPLERGKYLVESVVACGNCHSTRGEDGNFVPGMNLAGGFLLEDKMMTAFAPNITPDKETGIGAWTDAQILTAIREGKHPSGKILGPPMPFAFYRYVSDDDAKAIVAYLRSIKPVRNAVPRARYRIPLPPAWGPPINQPVSAPPRSDTIAYGAYLAGPLGHCLDCHTPRLPNGAPDLANRAGAGGFHLEGPWGEVVSANITPDKETGIGTWTDAQIKRAITQGNRADGSPLSPPMGFGFYKNINEKDLDAIVAYFRSLRPIKNKVR